jgi:hypothetical protein
MKKLITSSNLTFTKKNCNCGITTSHVLDTSSKRKKQIKTKTKKKEIKSHKSKKNSKSKNNHKLNTNKKRK